jgi:uncharacterized membrane-anchored protein YitT (DUF2179 family)
VIDTVLQGISYDKVALIISDKYELIGQKIINDLHRGGTFIKGKGMYAGNERTLIYVVLNRRELSGLEEYIHLIDPHAFLTVIDASEILGSGFKSLREKVEE